MKKRMLLLLAALCLLPLLPLQAASFNGDARIEISDSTGGLSWNGNSLTVSCWFKVSIPSGVTPPETMTILADRRGGTFSNPHAYHLYYDRNKNGIKFSTRGGSGFWEEILIPKLCQNRWYHVAVVRNGDTLQAFVDGVSVKDDKTINIGDSGSVDGVSIGGWNTVNYLYGEVQEVAIYQRSLSAAAIQGLMYKDQDLIPELKGYYKLGYSANSADYYRNFSSSAPAGTESGTKTGGEILFEEANWKGEQSLFDSQVNGGKNAVVPLSGAFSWQHSIFRRPLPGVPFDFSITYSPGLNGALGKGWSHSFESRADTLYGSTSPLKITSWQGSAEVWEIDSDAFSLWNTRHGEYRGDLCLDISTTDVLWTNAVGQILRFRQLDGSLMEGALLEIGDRNGNSAQIQWDETPAYDGRITNVVDSAGGEYYFAYNDDDVLETITYDDWLIEFSYDSSNRLARTSVSNTGGLYASAPTSWSFLYNDDNGLLEKIVNPGGITNLYVEYDNFRRRIRTTNALGEMTRMEYGVPGNRQMRTTDPEGFQWIDTYDRKGRMIVRRDPLGNETRFSYDEYGNRVSVTDPMGRMSFMGYDDRANLIAHTNALGEITARTFHPAFNKPLTQTNALGWETRYQYDSVGNLLSKSDDLGTNSSYTYTARGQLETATDANGNSSTNTYNADGYVISRTDSSGATTRFLPNEMGWNRATTNALGEISTSTYDINGNVLSATDALGRTYTATYTPCGKPLTQTDAKGQTSSSTYNNLGQQTSQTDCLGNTTTFVLSSRGNTVAVTNALGHATSNSYDAANRSVESTDALDHKMATAYDACGNPVASVDPLGQRWSRVIDPLNRAVAQADPGGRTARTFYDPAGRVSETISPDGSASQHEYDGRGRLLQWTDAAGGTWHYAYDAVGNITNVTDALGGTYSMEYGPRNERTMERNQDGFEWHYEYDELMRLKTQIDPNGIVRTMFYDAGGRLTDVAFSTGRQSVFEYDANDNLTVASRIDGVTTDTERMGYDAMDRLIAHTNAFGHALGYERDALGRITRLTYPDGKTLDQTYDAMNRLTSQAFHFYSQTFTASYAYDEEGKLVSRTYPNGIEQSNTFDGSGRLTGVTHSLPAPQPATLYLALEYAYDRNGNTIQTLETGGFEWPVPALRDETASYHPSGKLIQRDIDADGSQSAIAYLYDAGGNMTNATGNGQSWTLGYDEDNRVVSVDWDAGFTSKSIANRYDAFGRRIARTVDGIETRYVLDLAGSMERILCDAAPAGGIGAWYVHGPDLSFKVTPDGGLNCYHANAQGNIVAITGAYGINLVEYAYTPYGRSLGTANHVQMASLDTQPFMFCGSQGVMMEERGIPGFYFMRARYYSADAGVFLSIDPVRPIGPTWRPIAYGYADGNPLMYNDPNGEWLNIIVGAVVGAVVNAGIDIAIQLITEGEVDWGQVAGSALDGAITGAVIGSGAGILGLVAAGAAGGAAGSLLEQGLGGDGIDWGAVGKDAAVGGISGAFGGNKAKKLGSVASTGRYMKGLARNATNKGHKRVYQSISKQISKDFRSRMLKKGASDIVSGVAKGTASFYAGELNEEYGDIALTKLLSLFGESPPPPGPSYIPPAVWHPSSSPVFSGCGCGR